MKARKIPLILIGAEREADWTTYCEKLKRSSCHTSPRGYALGKEVEDLLDRLERHKCLGQLEGRGGRSR
jgi:hypothetical protein